MFTPWHPPARQTLFSKGVYLLKELLVRIKALFSQRPWGNIFVYHYVVYCSPVVIQFDEGNRSNTILDSMLHETRNPRARLPR